MPFINRDNGKIVASYNMQQTDGQEFINENDTEYLIFRDGDPKDIRKAEIESEANALIDDQAGNTSRKRMMMISEGLALLDDQVGKGQVKPRNPKQDQLVAIFEYISQVNVNMDTAFAAIDISNDPSTVILEHPSLP